MSSYALTITKESILRSSLFLNCVLELSENNTKTTPLWQGGVLL